MTWIKFICWLTGIYSFYYAGNVLWDLSRNRKLEADHGPELVLEEQVPQKITVEEKPRPKPPGKANPVIDSGGLRLQQLFAAARAESIIYTGGVTY